MAQTFAETTGTRREATGGLRGSRSLVIAIIGPVRIHRENLAAALGQLAGIEVIATAPTLDEALARPGGPPAPDVILVDVSGAPSTQSIPALPATCPDARMVALAAPDDDETIIACVTAGVAGFRRPGRNTSRPGLHRDGRRPRRFGLSPTGHCGATSSGRVLRPQARRPSRHDPADVA
jgi:hypothetical protein